MWVILFGWVYSVLHKPHYPTNRRKERPKRYKADPLQHYAIMKRQKTRSWHDEKLATSHWPGPLVGQGLHIHVHWKELYMSNYYLFIVLLCRQYTISKILPDPCFLSIKSTLCEAIYHQNGCRNISGVLDCDIPSLLHQIFHHLSDIPSIIRQNSPSGTKGKKHIETL